jgi:L-ascorbate metabolism protein UlaG (beta-lactamase superfamily)
MKVFIFLILTTLTCGVFAQEKELPLHYWGNPTEFFAQQAEQTFVLINNILDENPPTLKESLIRKSALFHMDWILHDTLFDDSENLYRFVRYRMEKVVDDLDKPVSEGVKIFKLYNDGFIVKTNSVTIAFDLNRGARTNKEPFIPDDLMKAIVDQCDILFITHEHSDHADWNIASLFVNKRKNVIIPDRFWENKSEFIRHIRSEEMISENIKLVNGLNLQVKVMPGYQDNVPNNVYIITTPEGFCIAHTGDQSAKGNDEWINHVKEHSSVDVLLVHCWAIPLERMINGFNPRLVITGHENEMTHSVDHRESYWLNYRRMEKVPQPKLFMTWGENFLYNRDNVD